MSACQHCGCPLPAGALFCGECGRTVTAAPGALADPERSGSLERFGGEWESWISTTWDDEGSTPHRDAPAGSAEPPEELSRQDARRVPVPDPPEPSAVPSARYVLQFSTGESVTVTGSGLIGRNPGAEPGEFVDQLVTLLDGGRSVSKTHLEFGQEQGRFWVSDRYSTNGSVVRPPDEPERRCEPGRRYPVSRGTRVDIGEQFFVVS